MFIKDLWYFVLPGNKLKSGTLLARTLLDEPVVIGRAADGRVFALRDVCPHRGMPLSYGHLGEQGITCCYHGWCFDAQGECVDIPCLSEAERFDTRRIKVPSYPCREVQGNVWIYMGDSDPPVTQIPVLPQVADRAAQVWLSMKLECDVDYAALGLIDPAHTPYVHHSPIWRSPGARREKTKHFAPSGLGFVMSRHQASSNSNAYRLLGGTPEVEIDFQLPGVRIEHIQAGRNRFCGLTTVTPVSSSETQIDHLMYWNMPWLTLFKPVVRLLSKYFLNQDRDATVKLRAGLPYQERPMFVREPDAQAKWYFSLKESYMQSVAEQRPFTNPLTEQTLHWKT